MLSFYSISRRLAVGAVLGLSFVSVESMAQSAQPFAGMSGVWSGKGSISLEGGANEAIRCRATYSVRSDGNALQQTLRCASDSYKIELTTRGNSQSVVIRSAGGEFKGANITLTRT